MTLTVVDNASASGEISQTVSVIEPPPNVPPTASFTSVCIDLVCSFYANGSSDSDGTIDLCTWTFGENSSEDNTATGETTSHTYAGADNYQVILTVTDNEEATDTSEQTIAVTEPAPPESGPITLELSGYSVKRIKYVDLAWSNITGDNVKIHRTKKRKAKTITTANDGAYEDSFKGGGTYIYKVCQADDDTVCSAEKTIVL